MKNFYGGNKPFDMSIDVKVANIKAIDFGRTFLHLRKVMKQDIKDGINRGENLNGGSFNKKGPGPYMKDTEKWLNNGIKEYSKKDQAYIKMSSKMYSSHTTKKGVTWTATFEDIGQLHNGQYATWRGEHGKGDFRRKVNPRAGNEFWGISVRLKKFLKSKKFNLWLAYDIKKAIQKAERKLIRVNPTRI